MQKKGIIIVIASLSVILALVVLKSFNKDAFLLDAKRAHTKSLEQTHILTLPQFKEKLQQMPNVTVIDLRSTKAFEHGHFSQAVNIPLAAILQYPEFHVFKDSTLVLVSNSLIESTQAWMLMTQMGYKNLFLFDGSLDLLSAETLSDSTEHIGSEVLKYKFQADSTINLE
ncbi:MAG TPA: hypothetical protein DCQ26_00485 [Marinilabiliales bacterium]|nr:MAG: hypothetical protein A2W84_17020 [Bacteroidetes bacterium GWC2_40_13]OFX75198.1 MAG: hypothetical protein A2W96_16495 [Bacteroidetes bacterium GWD2_40_43]OFX89795.1 MAG: hypothetical protein A2W97_12155 [Bacteroidetes bacterium GWE2_40_63]OFY22012.1 MAG: hypothetical protein A2W88_00690 [Bacteroidetes bacterium GWF2_40_13]OFZ26093.1 MAG: hypothetical protein A2437_10480 [Bacteroidetes bacterium RIFOXYC2_FULL_40_12]HAM97065.1 hypothetical protein [Marinilabiliales bacterium]